jgi:hypothetical protein
LEGIRRNRASAEIMEGKVPINNQSIPIGSLRSGKSRELCPAGGITFFGLISFNGGDGMQVGSFTALEPF